jgi:hypothetical protein
MIENWKIWPQNENYEVSNLGRVRSKSRWVQAGKGGKRWVEGKILCLGYNMNGYNLLQVSHWDNKLKKDKKKSYSLHRVVAETYIPNPNNLSDVNHKNGNKKDNRVENLEWMSREDNIQHARHVLGNTRMFSMKQLRELYEQNPNQSLGEFMECLEQQV